MVIILLVLIASIVINVILIRVAYLQHKLIQQKNQEIELTWIAVEEEKSIVTAKNKV